MISFRTQTLATLGFIMLALASATGAMATTIVAGSSIQFEIHAFENHSNQTLDGIDISFGSFATTNLMNSTLVGAIFVQTILTDTNFQNTDLTNADLTDAVFNSGTNLRNADLTGANLIGIDLTGVNVQNAIFIGATYDASSILPFDPVAAGMVVVPEQSPMMLIVLGLLVMAALKRYERGQPQSIPCAA